MTRSKSTAAWAAVSVLHCGAAMAAPPTPPVPPVLPPYYAYPFAPHTTEVWTLSLAEAIQAALAAASPYQLSRVDEQIAREDLSQARSARLPQLGSSLTYIGTSAAEALAVDPRVPSFVAANGIHHTTALVSVTGSLDVAGRLRAAVGRSRDLLQAAHARTAIERRSLVLATVDAYYGLSLARQKRRLADETLALAESFSAATLALAARGQAGEAERLRAEAEALRRRDELEQARATEAQAEDALRALIGAEWSVHLSVSRPGTDVPTIEAFAAYDASLVDGRPQLAQIDALERAAEDDVSGARADRRPQVVYALSSGLDASEARELRSFLGGSAMVGVSVPVFTFGLLHSREAQARLRLQSLELEHASTTRQLRQEFYSARTAAFAALERIEQSRLRADRAERALDLLLQRYRDKSATITELIDAQSAYADARAAHDQALTDYSVARFRLENDPERLAATAAQPPPVPPVEFPACAGAAPSLAGLRLGMTADEARGALPGLVVSAPDAAGVSHAEAPGVPVDDPRLSPTRVLVSFFDGRVYLMELVFPASSRWDTKEAFVSALAARTGLPPAGWRAFYDWSDRDLEDAEDLRALALECAGFRVRVGLGLFSEGVQRAVAPYVKLDDPSVRARIKAREPAPAR